MLTVQAAYGGRTGSLFEKTRGSLKERMIAITFWFLNEDYRTQKSECDISEHTLCDICIQMNALVSIYIEDKSEQIAGLFRIVEVDEVQLHRRKNGVGREKQEIWVIGGVQRSTPMDEGSPRMFLSILERRDAASISATLKRWVPPGSIICTDAFAGYVDLESLGYSHFDVNHKQNFVDALTKAHSERIEGLWHHLRRSVLPGTGAKSEDLSFFLSVYLVRRSVTVFEDFIAILRAADIQKLQKLTLVFWLYPLVFIFLSAAFV